MTPRLEDLHSISVERLRHDSKAATAVCSCGAEQDITGKTKAALWVAAYDWAAEHRRAVDR